MCRHCRLWGRALRVRGRRAELPNSDLLWEWDAASPVDPVAEEYLRETLACAGGALLPIQFSGDGNCLAHSLSRGMYSREIFYALIRDKVQAELAEHRAWYLEHLPSVTEEVIDAEIEAVRFFPQQIVRL